MDKKDLAVKHSSKNEKNIPVAIGCWILLLGIIAIIIILVFRSCSDSSTIDNTYVSSVNDNDQINTQTENSKNDDWSMFPEQDRGLSENQLEAVKADIITYSNNLDIIRKETVTSNSIPRIRTLLEDAQDFIRGKSITDSAYLSIKKELVKYKADLIKTQQLVYPKLRKAFADNAKNKLWEEDIKVQYSGTTITFIGYQYAANKNIKESYEAISDALHQLRFKRVNFKWSEGSEYTYYPINSPKDSEL